MEVTKLPGASFRDIHLAVASEMLKPTESSFTWQCILLNSHRASEGFFSRHQELCFQELARWLPKGAILDERLTTKIARPYSS